MDRKEWHRVRNCVEVRARLVLFGVLVVLVLAACGGPTGGGPSGGEEATGGELAPGGSVEGPENTWVAAPDDLRPGGVRVRIERSDGPDGVPHSSGVTQHGTAYDVEADATVGASPAAPFFVVLPIPAGADPHRLAVAIYESNAVIAPPEDDVEVFPVWSYVPAVVDEAAGVVVAPMLELSPVGWTMAVVEGPAFDSAPPTEDTALAQLSDPTFEGTCGPGFGGAVESCSVADLTLAAEMIEEAYVQLTGLGFTDDPRLLRGTSSFSFSFTTSGISVSWEPGPYQIELRPSSQVNAGGMFSIGSGRIWIAIGTTGLTEGRRSTVRHEYVHATQYGYDPVFDDDWLESRWVIEGHAVVAESSYDPLQRASRTPRAVDTTLRRSRWDGSDWDDPPSSEYRAQDFWWYLVQRTDGDVGTLRPFMEEGLEAVNVDTVLRTEFSGHFGGSGSDGGLPFAYWQWARNQAFEKQVDMTDSRFGDSCAFTPASATPTQIAYDRLSPPTDTTETLDPLTTRVYEIDFPAWSGGGYAPTMNVVSSASHLRSVFFQDGTAGTEACFDVVDLSSRGATVGEEDVRFYVLVGNTSYTSSATYTLSFDVARTVTIETPDDGASLDEGAIEFRASVTGYDDPSVFWVVEGTDNSFLWTPTTDPGETWSFPLCDGAYSVTAEAREGVAAARVSATIDLTILDLGDVGPPPECMPEVRIVDPSEGNVFSNAAPVTLRADAMSQGVTTYLTEWRLGSATAPVFATGPEVSWPFDPGPVNLFVTYGVAVDDVSFTVLDSTVAPPTAEILSPEDGTFFLWDDETAQIGNHTIPFEGMGTRDGGAGTSIPGSDLEWFVRRTDDGVGSWQSRGTGTEIDLVFGWNSCYPQDYDIRLQATDTTEGGLTGSDTISITIQPTPC